MNKTILKKLTVKFSHTQNEDHDFVAGDQLITDFRQEASILQEASRDLLSPRPEAISRLLELSRAL